MSWKLLTFPLMLLFFIGCINKANYFINYQKVNSEKFKDSLTLKNIGEIKLSLDSSTTFFNNSFILLKDSALGEGNTFFSIYNERNESIQYYSLASKKLESTIYFSESDTSGVGHKLANTAHFYLKSGEVVIFNYWKSRLNIFTKDGLPKKSLVLTKKYSGDSSLIWPMINNEFLSFQVGEDVYINNHYLGFYKDQSLVPAIYKINLQNGKLTNLFYRPQVYNYGFWGSFIRYQSSFIINDQNKLLINFPITPYVYEFDIATNKIDSFYVGSKYFKSIEPLIIGKKSSLTKSKDEIAEFTLTSPLFARLIFDKKNQLYYRMTILPRTVTEYHIRPYDPKISLIIFNKRFEKLGELLLPNKVYFPLNSIITDFGLLIPNLKKYQEDPNTLSFDIFNPANKMQ